MDNVTITTFNSIFAALEHAYEMDDPEFVGAVFEYAAFIGSSQYLSSIVSSLAFEEDIDPVIFFRLFMYAALRNGFRNQKLKREEIGMPLFINKKVEDKYHLAKKFMELLSSEKQAMRIAKKEEVSIFDIKSDFDEKNDPHSITNDQELFKFRILHNQILARAIQDQKRPPTFDEVSGILQINGTPIKFRKFTEQYHCLRILFSEVDLSDEHFFSEIGIEIDSSQSKYTDKNMHNYFSAIKNRIATETGIKDLFLTTNQSVRINPDYL